MPLYIIVTQSQNNIKLETLFKKGWCVKKTKNGFKTKLA